MSTPSISDKQKANSLISLSMDSQEIVIRDQFSMQSVKLPTCETHQQNWLCAKVKRFIVKYLPSCFQRCLPGSFIGPARIEVGGKIFYVPRNAIQKIFDSSGLSYSLPSDTAGSNAITLKCIALSYFRKNNPQ